MTSEYTEFSFGKLKIVANWNPNVVPCEKIKFIIDGVEQIIDRSDLYSLLFLFGDEKQQTDLVPTKNLRVRCINRLLSVRAKKDMKRGEILYFPYKYFVPEMMYDSIRLSEGGKSRGTTGEESFGKIEKDISEQIGANKKVGAAKSGILIPK